MCRPSCIRLTEESVCHQRGSSSRLNTSTSEISARKTLRLCVDLAVEGHAKGAFRSLLRQRSTSRSPGYRDARAERPCQARYGTRPSWTRSPKILPHCSLEMPGSSRPHPPSPCERNGKVDCADTKTAEKPERARRHEQVHDHAERLLPERQEPGRHRQGHPWQVLHDAVSRRCRATCRSSNLRPGARRIELNRARRMLRRSSGVFRVLSRRRAQLGLLPSDRRILAWPRDMCGTPRVSAWC